MCPDTLPDDAALCLYRIVQEALGNVVKHSGAGHAQVELTRSEDAVYLRITDDGVGFDPRLVDGNGGLGLVSMRERLRYVGGQITIDSQPSVRDPDRRQRPPVHHGPDGGALPAEPARTMLSLANASVSRRL